VTYDEILKHYWGFDDFRGIQREIIESIGSGHDTLGLMPTGGGKSITFQVPALQMEGVCIVVTPLIALMKDQVLHLKQKGIPAAAIFSGQSREEIITTLENCIFGKTKLLYVSPERLSSPIFQTKCKHMHVSFITVDEAHCISQWGYDFRPSYLHISDIRKLHPDVPVLALTATATPQVVDDIQEQLDFKEKRVFQMSFERKNLAYVVRHTTDKQEELTHILKSIDGCAIVYVRSRKKARETAELINDIGISATFYHAGLDSIEKDKRQKDWQTDQTRVMVATNAFGMGIDKPDVRLVIHTDCPDSPEAYFQEAGRAGRDGKKAYAVLLYNGNDHAKLDKRIIDTFPEKDYIKEVYEHLSYYYQIAVGAGYNITFEFDIDEFCRKFKHFPIQVDAALKILTRAGYIDYTEEQDTKARVKFLIGRDQLYRLEGNTPQEDKVIVALLRSYGGLFSDYCFIDESLIAQQAGINKQQAYFTLRSLTQKHILNFIPSKRTPYIRYSQRREDSENVMIGQDIYEDRKKQFQTRIYAMLEYATNDEVCRSRQLLKYFGEMTDHDCGQCDVCLSHRSEGMVSESIQNQAKEMILQQLADSKRHPLEELLNLSISHDAIDAALITLINEEAIFMEDGFIFLTKKK
jgi:ATP-dependent DNA helicase RecQ